MLPIASPSIQPPSPLDKPTVKRFRNSTTGNGGPQFIADAIGTSTSCPQYRSNLLAFGGLGKLPIGHENCLGYPRSRYDQEIVVHRFLPLLGFGRYPRNSQKYFHHRHKIGRLLLDYTNL